MSVYNICFTIANISKTGGEERMCALLANELVSQGNDVTIVSQNNYYWQKSFFQLDRRVKTFSMKRCFCEYIICKLFRSYKYDIQKYRRLLKKNAIQLIIDVDTEMSLSSVTASEGLGIKIISWEHFCYQRFSERPVSNAILSCIKSKVDALVVLTKADESLFVNEGGIQNDKVYQIYNPSPIEMTEPISHHENKVITMGRLEPEKGYDLLLQAWEIVERSHMNWHLEIIGNGSQKDNLVKQCSALGLRYVTFTPFTSTPIEKYREASIYALSSRHEGLSLVLLEAANMSLPIVAFDCPNGPGEIIKDGINGYLVENGNVEAFADALLHLMQMKEERERIAGNSLISVAEFKRLNIMNKWNSLIDLLLAK